MTNEEAIAIIKIISAAFVEPVTKEQRKLIDDTFDMAIEALEQQPCEDVISIQAAIDALTEYGNGRAIYIGVEEAVRRIEQLPSVNTEKTGRWIPVGERLPENRNQEVLISLEWGIDIGRYSDGEWHSEWINHYDDGNVLAWMPLPLPPCYEPQESDHKCHTCKHYTSGEHDGSCGSYICEHYSNWESEDKECTKKI